MHNEQACLKSVILIRFLLRRQVAIALSGAGHAGAEIVYFELDQAGQLNEFTERKVFRDAEITCMSLSEIPEGEIRSRFLAIGANDNTVRIISLDHNDTLSPLRFVLVCFCLSYICSVCRACHRSLNLCCWSKQATMRRRELPLSILTLVYR